MNEEEWLVCRDPLRMLREIGFAGVTFRKCRLFCCAYCRTFFWKHLHPSIQEAIEIAEAYADQSVSKYRLRKAQAAYSSVEPRTNAQWRAYMTAQLATSATNPFESACQMVEARYASPGRGGKKAVASLIREIFGFLFGPVLAIEPPLLAWNDNTIPKLAEGIYNDRAFERMPLLADALEEAGCSDESILDHCRGGGVHARGCWVVDALTGRQ